jgi:hypothetical protein
MKKGEMMKEDGRGNRGQSKKAIFDRRLWLQGAGAGAGMLLAGGLAPRSPAQLLPGLKPGAAFASRSLDPKAGLSVILLGTGTPLPNPERACAATPGHRRRPDLPGRYRPWLPHPPEQRRTT